ncbi:hypothetical protein KNV66_gp12 [Bacillus phage DLc1]|uniref:Uncharacterized protein n=1 Tax=Bacillus phage DLc1 TaxID=2777318 RepID=A0A7M1RQU4_9CAUD|nr:hypothetical protein KNV66_gp12 [Bacillus phage DLc1]QOR56291.1 hypothetical protein [Bacillus phage DLc1]
MKGFIKFVYKGDGMMLSTFVGLGVLGVLTIGGTVLERRFAEEGKTSEAKLIGDGLFHVVRCIGVATIIYTGFKIVVWFL